MNSGLRLGTPPNIRAPLTSDRLSPLPDINWADTREVWELMVDKDKKYRRNPLLLQLHPNLQGRMRAILLDWLSEVSEVYKLHRESYYLALDYIDRYLSSQENVPKQSLQLIGITCLFIAAKIEEIYPPNLKEFAYVTDGACTEDEIIGKELIILKTLKWKLYPMTINSWLCVYLQLYSLLDKENNEKKVNSRKRKLDEMEEEETDESDKLMIPRYSSYFFSQIAHLVDLCTLDMDCLLFQYNIIAASALYHFTSEEIVYKTTGLKLKEIRDCVLWMTPFALAIRDEGFNSPKLQKYGDSENETHPNLQSHTVDLALLKKSGVIKDKNQQT